MPQPARPAAVDPTRLMVPIEVEALVVGTDGNRTTWADVTPNFDLIPTGLTLGEKLTPAPFQTAPNPAAGAHLHWALPDALTHGTEVDDGGGEGSTIRYPLVPNRWFVLRVISEVAKRSTALRAWVIESDRLSADPGAGVVRARLETGVIDEAAAGRPRSELRRALADAGFATTDRAVLIPTRSPSEWRLYDGTRRLTLRRAPDGTTAVTGDESITWPTLDDEKQYFMYLGRSFDYAEWQADPPPEHEANLTAVGPGDPVFSGYYPSCHSVFGFHDPLDDVPGDAKLTYLVTGWYADPAGGPLAGADTIDAWTARMETLEWTVQEPPTSDPPTDLLLHGMVQGLPWTGAAGPYPSGVPDADPELAVGNTYVEALSALIASKLPADADAETLLEAFQYGLLDVYDHADGPQELELALHEASFGATPGGTLWEIVRTPTSDREAGPPETDALFPADVGELLGTLTVQQGTLETASAELASLQWELYSTWYKRILLELGPGPTPPLDPTPDAIHAAFADSPGSGLENRFQAPVRRDRPARRATAAGAITIEQVNQLIERLEGQVSDRKAGVDRTAAAVAQTRAALEQKVAAEMKGYELVASQRPRYWTPNDPVLLFAGGGTQRSFKHGADGRFTSDGSLLCRLPGRTVTGLLMPPATVPVAAEQLQGFWGEFPAGQPIPAGIPALFVEVFLVDPLQAELLAVAVYAAAGVKDPTAAQIQELAGEIRTLQRDLWRALARVAPAPAGGETGEFEGTPPSKVAVAAWAQPWTPMYFQWQVQWYPSYLKPADALDDHWLFGDVAYAWNTKYPPDQYAPKSATFQGRDVMAPSPALHLHARLLQYLSDHPDDPHKKALQDIADQIQNVDVLAQAMGGLNAAMVMRNPSLQLPVLDLFDPDIGQGVQAAIDGQNGVAPQPEYAYVPIRAGHFAVLRLWIVDAFGQVQRLADQDRHVTPLRAQPVVTAGAAYANLIQLPPRLAQPARLELRWRQADDDARETDSDPATSPVCGWLLPNHLDNSLMVYDAAGHARGALQLVIGGMGAGGSAVRWTQAPGTPSPVGAPPDLPNPHLQGFVQGLLDQAARGQDALAPLLRVIDETLGTIDPVGSRRSDNLSLLVGRPLAVVRASLRLSLQGLPEYDQSWDALLALYTSGTFETGGFDKVAFTARLGDVRRSQDGTLGYFVDHDYSVFHSTYAPPPGTDGGGYVDYDHLIPLTCADAMPVFLTMILDPRGAVHVTTDILPTKAISLPPYGVDRALQAIDVTFRTGPLIQERDALRVPLPAGITGSWSWVYQPDVIAWTEDTTLEGVADAPQLEGRRRVVREGWLKLSDAFGRPRGGTS